jgi:hypothetical protein
MGKHIGRESVFSFRSDPAVDRPLCRKSKSYVADLLERGEAIRLNAFSVQLIDRSGELTEAQIKAAAVGDWITRHISFLPKEFWKTHGPILRITTKQIETT